MKKLLIAILLIAGMTWFCFYFSHHVESICNTSAALLEQAETDYLLGDQSAAISDIIHSRRVWNRNELFLGTALRHTESDDVGILYSVLLESCSQGSDEFLTQNRELIATLRHLSRMEQPYLFNIL